MEMDNHMSDKDESCYDNAEAAFSDDEEDLNSKGEADSKGWFRIATALGEPSPRSSISAVFLSYYLCTHESILLTTLLNKTQGCSPAFNLRVK